MPLMNKLLSIGQASKALGVTIQTLRNWDKKGLTKLLNQILDGKVKRLVLLTKTDFYALVLS